MHWDWQLALEFVKALAWPVVVSGAVIAFRRQIAAKIGDLKETTTPIGGASFFDRHAEAVRTSAEAAHERQEQDDATAATESQASADLQGHIELTADIEVTPAPAAPASEASAESTEGKPESRLESGGWQDRPSPEATFLALTSAWATLDEAREFDVARRVATDSPRAGVMLAYADLEKVGRAAWTVHRLAPPGNFTLPSIVRRLIQGGGLDKEFEPVIRDLSRLRSEAAHGRRPGEDISVSGAMDYIEACEQLAQALAGNAMSKLRHPSRSKTVGAWLRWAMDNGSLPGGGKDPEPPPNW